MKTHRLKTVNPYFQECFNGTKKFEVRLNDRDFKIGDTVYLQEYDAETNTYSGNELRCSILYILENYPALQKGYIVFSIQINQIIKKK